MGQRCNQVLLGYHRENINVGVDEKAFKSSNSLSSQSRNLCLVSWDYSAPGGPIYTALTMCSLSLRLKSAKRGSGRQAIQRHVNEQSVSSSCRRSGGGRESFPFGATGLVDVYVRVNQAGQNGNIAEIENICASRRSFRLASALNALVLGGEGRRANAVWR